MYLHREGKKIILLVSLLLVIAIASVLFLNMHFIWQCLILVPTVILYLLILWFFRVPVRSVNFNDKLLYAPADGKIVVIEETTENEYLHEKRIQISIFMSPLNIHQNSYPIGGKVLYTKYHKGKYLVAWHPKSSTDNERCTIVVEHQNGTRILIRQIAGAVARRICNYSRPGENVKQGEELGFIKFGSRVDVFVPITAKIVCQVDQISRSKLTVLAEL